MWATGIASWEPRVAVAKYLSPVGGLLVNEQLGQPWRTLGQGADIHSRDLLLALPGMRGRLETVAARRRADPLGQSAGIVRLFRSAKCCYPARQPGLRSRFHTAPGASACPQCQGERSGPRLAARRGSGVRLDAARTGRHGLPWTKQLLAARRSLHSHAESGGCAGSHTEFFRRQGPGGREGERNPAFAVGAAGTGFLSLGQHQWTR